WHCWAQVGGTAGRHRWVHCWTQEGALLGTGGCTAGTGGRNWWVALLGTDHQCPDARVRKVQPRTGNCISRRSACHWTRLITW
ncbi:unnamed protein product, partial [Staurois parvus]